MELDEVLTLMDHFSDSACTTLKLSWRGDTLELERALSAIPTHGMPMSVSGDPTQGDLLTAQVSISADEHPAEDASASFVRAPILGTFHRAPAPDADPFVETGQAVHKGQTLCIIEAMKMMNEVTSEKDCTIEEVLLDNGTTCEYDTPLFRIRES
jgi:acetyl-CoA carboxylase biotin carboxyl carrier protein